MDYSTTAIQTAEFDGLDWTESTTEALAGFCIKAAEVGPGPEGVLVMHGAFSDGIHAEVSVHYEDDPPAGLRLHIARMV